MDGKGEIEVITTMPNRYASFEIPAPTFEQEQNVTIRRIKLPAHRSGKFDQSKAFLFFAKEALKLTKNKEYTLIFATSSRLMTASVGAWIAFRKKTKLYLDIRDIFIDNINHIFPSKLAACFRPVFSILEKCTFSRADKINIVSQGFKDDFNLRYPKVALSYFTNGIDPEFLTTAKRINHQSVDAKPLTVLYAGNIGAGQGLDGIIPDLAKQLEGRAHFKIIGDGGKRNCLEQAIKDRNCVNVELLSPMNRKRLIMEYQKADILFLHLSDYSAYRKVLPSKIFEYAATGKPIWAGLSGYSADFVHTELTNTAVFYPGDTTDALHTFSKLKLETETRSHFIQKFSRDSVMSAMALDILNLV